MEENDELVPARPRGRPMRSLGPDALDETRSDRRCRECPKYGKGHRWCPLKACMRSPDARVCKYGLLLLNAAALAERRAGNAKASA